MSKDLNNLQVDGIEKNCESPKKSDILRESIKGLCVLALATTLNVANPKDAQANEVFTPKNAIPVHLIENGPLTDIPFGARKVVLGDSELFVWKNENGEFSMQITKIDENNGTDDIHFEANVGGENYIFSLVGEDALDQVMIAEKSPDRESAFGIDYNRMSRGNYILKNIMLSAEERLSEYMKNVEGYDENEIITTLNGMARGFARDGITNPTLERFRGAYPELLTSFSFLDQNKYPNLYVIGELESNRQQAQNATQQAQNATQQAQNATQQAQNATQQAQNATQNAKDWTEINKKLAGK